jgi:hypothetical protein
MAALDIDDAQAPVAEMRPGIVIKPKIVWAAMADYLGHASQGPVAAAGRPNIHKSGNPAHE